MLVTKTTISFSQSSIKPVFNHTTVYVYDLDKNVAFYEKVIGLNKINDPFKDGKHVWFKIAPHSQLHVVKGSVSIAPHDINIHLSLSVGLLRIL